MVKRIGRMVNELFDRTGPDCEVPIDFEDGNGPFISYFREKRRTMLKMTFNVRCIQPLMEHNAKQTLLYLLTDFMLLMKLKVKIMK